MPQGTMRSKRSRSVVALNAKPWLVTHRENPDADRRQLLRVLHPRPRVKPSTRVPAIPYLPATRIRTSFEIAHIAMDVAPVGLQIE